MLFDKFDFHFMFSFNSLIKHPYHVSCSLSSPWSLLRTVTHILNWPQWGNIAMSFSSPGHGFKLAPAVGKAVSELVLGKPPSYKMSPFTISRFSIPSASLWESSVPSDNSTGQPCWAGLLMWWLYEFSFSLIKWLSSFLLLLLLLYQSLGKCSAKNEGLNVAVCFWTRCCVHLINPFFLFQHLLSYLCFKYVFDLACIWDQQFTLILYCWLYMLNRKNGVFSNL